MIDRNRNSRMGVGKGVKHRYPSDPNRKPMTERIRRRIVEATQLLAMGDELGQVAEKLDCTIAALANNRDLHRAFWDMCFREATKATGDALKELAGTPELFRNKGRLIRLAAEASVPKAIALHADKGPNQTLTEFLEDVYLPSRIGVSRSYVLALRKNVRRFVAFVGRDIRISEFNESDVAKFLACLRQTSCGVTVNKARQCFLTLWGNAFDYGFIDRPPRRGLVRRVAEEVDPPEAWDAQQISALMTTASVQVGTICDIPAGKWWLSLLLAIYYSGCRIGAMMKAKTELYRPGEGLLVRNQKNHRPQFYCLPGQCCRAIDATDPESRELLWPWHEHPRMLWVRFRRIVEDAGIPAPKTGRQLFHRLRRTTLSLCAAVDPAVAQRQAGHASYATTLKHYVDPRVCKGLTAADVLPKPKIDQD